MRANSACSFPHSGLAVFWQPGAWCGDGLLSPQILLVTSLSGAVRWKPVYPYINVKAHLKRGGGGKYKRAGNPTATIPHLERRGTFSYRIFIVEFITAWVLFSGHHSQTHQINYGDSGEAIRLDKARNMSKLSDRLTTNLFGEANKDEWWWWIVYNCLACVSRPVRLMFPDLSKITRWAQSYHNYNNKNKIQLLTNQNYAWKSWRV